MLKHAQDSMNTASATLKINSGTALYLFHHVFLPPKLPQEDDQNPKYELILLDSVIHALGDFRNHVPSQQDSIIASVITMVCRLKTISTTHGDVSKAELKKALEVLDTDGGYLPIHVRCQNAAVLMTRKPHAIHIESFELSPRNEAVNTTIGRLQRQFPGPTFAFDRNTFNEAGFQDTIAETLSRMSHQPVAGTKPKVRKAGQLLDEERDTTDPMMVTEFFMAFLRPRCTVVESVQLKKNTREEVLWLDSNLPWRRSSLWLLIRVSLQLVFRRLCIGEDVSDDLYKQFMVYYSGVLLRSCISSLCSEKLYMMNAKIGRRLRKLDLSYRPGWLPFVQSTLERTHVSIQQSWRDIQKQSSIVHGKSKLETLKFGEDIFYDLSDLDRYIESIGKRQTSRYTGYQPRPGFIQFKSTELPSVLDVDNSNYKSYRLAAFEDWVDSNLDAWLDLNLVDETTCQQLSKLIMHYYDLASSKYSKNPVATSGMLLTILRLWIACDMSAVHNHPMLGDYDPCIPMKHFESLVLPYQWQLARLARAEEYMHRRQQCIKYHGNHLFESFGTSSCFSVRYFDRSAEHQRLLESIEDCAERERMEKKEELRQKHAEYKRLYALADKIQCTYDEVVVDRDLDIKESRHSPYCDKHVYMKKADSITIDIHEWPLPSDALQAKTTVFELKIPASFAFWRDTTAFFLLKVLHVDYSVQMAPRAEYRPQEYIGLSSFYTCVVDNQRFGLLSQDKPHRSTHRRDKRIIGADETNICLANGMHFKYFDNRNGCFVKSFKLTDKIPKACTYKLPQSSSSLQRSLYRPAEQCNGLLPNTVIASQDVCPVEMSLGEYKALCSMPFGLKLQWANILKQLAMPSVVFKKVDTCIFVLQIIHQAGPSSLPSILRTAHQILSDNEFVAALLAEIKKAIGRIQENWESAQELNALIFLTQRVLSLTLDEEIQNLCLEILGHLRDVAFNWVNIVKENASAVHDDKHRSDLNKRSARLALICVGTFDCEGNILQRILETDSVASVFIQCCILIQDRKDLLNLTCDVLDPILFHRWQILSYRCHLILAHNIIHRQNSALDIAIGRTWSSYNAESLWSFSSGQGDCWLASGTRNDDLVIHFNLMTGELLINGQRLARLPLEYEQHETYKTLFGPSVVEVMPSDVPGMHFSGQKEYMGQNVHLGRSPASNPNGFDLCVRAIAKGNIREFVPPRLLSGAFPDAFVKDYVHWYDVESQSVDFCPAKEPWHSSTSHWRLHRVHSENSWRLEKAGLCLVSVNSRTAKLISEICKPIERAPKLHCMLHVASGDLEIEIPRLRLVFDLCSSHSSIQSRQYRNMSIDHDQSLGTLVGLRSRLILRHVSSHERVVIIPEGKADWERKGDHIDVTIEWQPVTNLHVYAVDSQLGRLVDNGSLQSKLILCYLHAVTSYCIPDTLTQKTGTEQSLSILRSAAMRSFNILQPENTGILMIIAGLSPRRTYYPANERVMQSVTWQHDLACLAQHGDFREQVAAIFEQHHRMRMFHPDLQPEVFLLPDVYANQHVDLLQRDRIRSSSFRVSGYGAEDHTSKHDHHYSGLGHNSQSNACSRIYTICKMIYDESSSFQEKDYESLKSCLWSFLSMSKKVHGPDAPFGMTEIRYDASYILEAVELASDHWCSIHRLLRSDSSRPNRYHVMIWLSTLALSDKLDMMVLETIVALYVNPHIAYPSPPNRPSFQPKQGYEIREAELESVIQSTNIYSTPEAALSKKAGETQSKFQSRKKLLAKTNRAQALSSFIKMLQTQWATSSPYTPECQQSPDFKDYFNMEHAMTHVRAKFLIWFDNRNLRQYLTEIASILASLPVCLIKIPSVSQPRSAVEPYRISGFVCFDDILDGLHCCSPVLQKEPPRLRVKLDTNSKLAGTTPQLLSLVKTLESQAKSEYERSYIEQLRGSAWSLQVKGQADHIHPNSNKLEEKLSEYLSNCEKHYKHTYDAIASSLTFSGYQSDMAGIVTPVSRDISRIVASIGNWPRLSPDALLHQLTWQRWSELPHKWKRCFLAYGTSITALQRARRLVNLIGHREDLIQELKNPGHTNWDPYHFPESLLLEIENGILIRDVQEQIAHRMRHIEIGENAVMQLNMGEGKSSVIVPIVAAAHADGSCLVRVIVAKPQSRQMFQMLSAKLGGLLNRRVYHMPVSRSLSFSKEDADEVYCMCLECMANGGVLLIQPEHILSLKLMCVECFITGKAEVGSSLLRTLEFFRTSSRDLVDESDENFSVKFELIYTMGVQRPLELSPQRWVIIQQVLDLIRMYAPAVKDVFPRSIEVDEKSPGSFPRVRLLDENAGIELLNRIGEHVCNNGIDSLPITRRSENTRSAVLTYILKSDNSAQEVAAVENDGVTGFWTVTTKEPLLLLRGLLAGGVLAFCLGQKRWRVNYGPDHARSPPTKLSVPYRAKDNPATRSEFSHPDVVIVLTCLSYYYAGLSDEELFIAFGHLIDSDQADTEYRIWVSDAPKLPQVYHQLIGINLQDRHLCLEKVFPNLRFAKGAVDYFLAHVVFPKFLKEFPDKLSASGWDTGEIKAYPTVGFSGTNDSRMTLPLSVRQLDLQEQNHTNALVLEYILRSENSVAFVERQDDSTDSHAHALLDMVTRLEPPTQVILDVGAQILELSNLDVAKDWLRMIPNDGLVQAVVFVNDSHEICVVDRNERVEPLQISPFAKQLEACFVFLDEAHTRGIDLKLPQHYRAAVTLGAGITKDKLVQACMRMRKLGKGQSVIFCIPEEIKTKILSLIGRPRGSEIDVSDVLCWAVSNTWVDMQRSIPLWAIQGQRYDRQSKLWLRTPEDNQLRMSQSQAEDFLETESQSLEQRYRPRHKEIPVPVPVPGSDDNENIRRILARCREFADLNFSSTELQEEQERELAPEIEQERQVQRPPAATPANHDLHPDLRLFVSIGILKTSSDAFKPAFEALRNTTAAKYLDVSEFHPELLVTEDFANTIQVSKGLSILDNYQRPVEWILTSIDSFSSGSVIVKHMVIISPYEANELHPEVQKSKFVMMHLYAPRQNPSFKSLDNLTLYNVSTTSAKIEIPKTLKIQLNLFAGQLYIENYKDYQEICGYLGVASVKTAEGLTVAADGFILANDNSNPPFETRFSQSPLKFLRLLMSQMRKDGQEIDKTHIGKILDGRLLSESDFQESPMKHDFSERSN